MAIRPLPAQELDLLTDLRYDLPALRARVVLLRAAGWSIGEIATPLGVSRSAVQAWETSFPRKARPGDPGAPLPPSPPHRPTSTTRSPRAPRATGITPRELTQIQQLAPLARRNRHGTPPSSELRQASESLTDLFVELYERGVRQVDLAEAAGLNATTVNQRIRTAQRRAAAR